MNKVATGALPLVTKCLFRQITAYIQHHRVNHRQANGSTQAKVMNIHGAHITGQSLTNNQYGTANAMPMPTGMASTARSPAA